MGWSALACLAVALSSAPPPVSGGPRLDAAPAPLATGTAGGDEHAVVFAGAPAAGTAASLPDDDMVIGVVVGSEARAYPVRFLWEESGHTVNDTLGGQPVAVSMCPLAGVGAALSRRAGAETLEIGSLSRVEKGSLLLYDARTHTAYRLLTGEAFSGPRSGQTLERLPTVFTTWGRWRAAYPGTTLLRAPGAGDDYQLDATRLRRMVLSGLSGRGPAADRDWVVGVPGPDGASAFLVRALAFRRAANETLSDRPVVLFLTGDMATVVVRDRRVLGRTLTFRADGDRMRDDETGSIWDPVTGQAVAGPLAGRTLALVPSQTGFWHAWKAAYPSAVLRTTVAD